MIHYKKGLLPGALWLNRRRHRVVDYVYRVTRTNISKKGMQYSSAWLQYIGRSVTDPELLSGHGESNAFKMFPLLENFVPHISDTDKKIFKAKQCIAGLYGLGAITDVHDLLMEAEV
jgi:hypothetical protein